MTILRIEHRNLEVSCGLRDGDAALRLAAWGRLREQATVEPIPAGRRLRFAPALRDTALELLGAEAVCCPFLDFALDRDGERLRLDVTSPAPEAGPVIAALVGEDRPVTNPTPGPRPSGERRGGSAC